MVSENIKESVRQEQENVSDNLSRVAFHFSCLRKSNSAMKIQRSDCLSCFKFKLITINIRLHIFNIN